MNLRLVSWLRNPLIVLGWATATSALTLVMIFNGQFVPRNINGGGLFPEVTNPSPFLYWGFYLGAFAVCILACLVIASPARSLALFFPSYIGAAVITWLVLALPDFLVIDDPAQVLQEVATLITFNAFFPILLLTDFAATIAGIALAERFL
jgi:hypothetical protein